MNNNNFSTRIYPFQDERINVHYDKYDEDVVINTLNTVRNNVLNFIQRYKNYTVESAKSVEMYISLGKLAKTQNLLRDLSRLSNRAELTLKRLNTWAGTISEIIVNAIQLCSEYNELNTRIETLHGNQTKITGFQVDRIKLARQKVSLNKQIHRLILRSTVLESKIRSELIKIQSMYQQLPLGKIKIKDETFDLQEFPNMVAKLLERDNGFTELLNQISDEINANEINITKVLDGKSLVVPTTEPVNDANIFMENLVNAEEIYEFAWDLANYRSRNPSNRGMFEKALDLFKKELRPQDLTIIQQTIEKYDHGRIRDTMTAEMDGTGLPIYRLDRMVKSARLNNETDYVGLLETLLQDAKNRYFA